MSRWIPYNNNSLGRNVGDCTVRAISRATGDSWETTYTGLCVQGFMQGDMPSSNDVWGAYLRRKGFVRKLAPEDESGTYNVARFCHEHPSGTYVLALSRHVVCVENGFYYDTWDSGDEAPLYYWERKEDRR